MTKNLGKRKSSSQDTSSRYFPTQKKAKPSSLPENDEGCSVPVAKTSNGKVATASNSAGNPATSTADPTKDSQANLEALLDLTGISTQPQLQTRFDTIAKALLHDYHLVITTPTSSTTLEVLEMEFYLQIEGWHEDPFTHGTEEQRVAGRWYFHRAPRPSKDSNRSLTSTSTTSWRGGSRKGLDITIGRAAPSTSDSTAEETLLRGGILLRSIRVLSPNKPAKVISGPSLLVDEVLSRSGASSIGDLVNGKWGGDTSAFPAEGGLRPAYSLHFVLKPASPTNSKPISATSFISTTLQGAQTIYTSPRIGLDLSHPGTTPTSVRPLHSRIVFLPRPYRFFVEPHALTANGRAQTFLGVLMHVSKSLDASGTKGGKAPSTGGSKKSGKDPLSNPKLLADVCRLSGFKDPTASRYLEDYLQGKEEGEEVLKGCIGKDGKGVGGSPKRWLTMMGALEGIGVGSGSGSGS